ncbi:C4-dicarboxylate transporter, DctQ subunit [Desulfotomaculum arcticum]|uniref:C4-dicarboxylate transporter, DctQ subunit n=1 Tax=Desulfotruncus arcticus DSM 17038 TaxID=1121424 RepID=A0A1I2S1U4_9FIRM|nr:TRAP transporter small permease [Desulfotruncus arcticus]SFG46303.1 C4-dicarboxylate transporter, DctQ subunit [Desulfotomaculum arcticum] [Desulfotruncus arcticus DSM 17038]
METIKKVYKGFEDYFAGGMLFTGLTLVFINVVLRYVWGRPKSIFDEFSVYFIVWGTLAGIAVALRNDHHIKVDMLYNFLSTFWKHKVSIFACTLGFAFCIFYTFYGIQLEMNYLQNGMRSPDSRFPMWIVYLIVPISGVMFGIRFIDKLVGLLKNGGKDWMESTMRGVKDNVDRPSV